LGPSKGKVGEVTPGPATFGAPPVEYGKLESKLKHIFQQ